MTRETIVTHPDNRAIFEQHIKKTDGHDRIYSIPIVFDPYMPQFNEVWYPPRQSRFVAYDNSDEGWMRPLGLGVIHKEPVIYSMRFPF